MAGNHSAAVLRNKGVSVRVYETEAARDLSADGTVSTTFRRVLEGESPVVTTAWVRFDGNALADVEEAFEDLGKFQAATAKNPFTTVRRALAIVFGWDDEHPRRDDGTLVPSGRDCPGCRRAGLAMTEGGTNEYVTAMVAAMSLANGLDPSRVLRMVQIGVKAEGQARDERTAALDEMIALEDALDEPGAEPAAASTSTDGSDPGSLLDAASTSSGD